PQWLANVFSSVISTEYQQSHNSSNTIGIVDEGGLVKRLEKVSNTTSVKMKEEIIRLLEKFEVALKYQPFSGIVGGSNTDTGTSTAPKWVFPCLLDHMIPTEPNEQWKRYTDDKEVIGRRYNAHFFPFG